MQEELAAFANVLGEVPGTAQRAIGRRLCRTGGSNDSARRYFMTRTREREETRMAGMTFGNDCWSHERSGAMHNDCRGEEGA